MIPLGDRLERRTFPWVTYTLVALLVLIYLWDRNWAPFGPRVVFTDLACRPSEVWAALRGGDKEALLTLFTSMFLHADVWHLLFNLIFLVVFGPKVEEWFGSFRFALFYLFFGIAAMVTQAFVTPSSGASVLGASGAIAGVMGSYLLLFPGSELDVVIPPWPIVVPVPAWIMLGIWFLVQILFVQPGVANWAHAGGFLAGMIIVLLSGPPPRNDRAVEGGNIARV